MVNNIIDKTSKAFNEYEQICLNLINNNKLNVLNCEGQINSNSKYNNNLYIIFLIILSIVTFITFIYKLNNKNKNKKNNYMKYIINLIILLQFIIIIYIIYKIINNNILFNKFKKIDMNIIRKAFINNAYYKTLTSFNKISDGTNSLFSIFNNISKIFSFFL